MKHKKIIGFDRKIEMEWLDYTAELVSNGLPEPEIREKLTQKLSVYGLGSSKGGAQSKTITILTRLWLNPPEEIIQLRDKAIELYKSATNEEKVILHICLATINYPFFFDVMTQIGRLLNLQDSFSSDQIIRRMIEKWGDTQRVKRSVGHVLQTLKLWGVIEPLQKRSIYCDIKTKSVLTKGILFFTENSLKISLGNEFSIREPKDHPAMFFYREESYN